MRALRLSLAAVFAVAATLFAPSQARADSACTSLPGSGIYDNWFTGGYQVFGGTISGARGYIRTYNPFVYYNGGSTSAWVMGVNGTRYAQAGWAKAPTNSDPYNPVFFIQYTDATGHIYPPQWYGTIYPPNVYFYQANSPATNGVWTFQMGSTIVSGVGLGWLPNEVQSFGEEWNFSGDQTAGDRLTHTTFRSVQYSDFSNWWFTQFGTPSNPYQAGTPNNPSNPDRGDAGYDALTASSGSDFDIWDARCP